MDGFQKIVVIIAVILLIIIIALIGYALSRATKQDWPPVVPECPDYWIAKGSTDLSGSEVGTGPFCVNVKNLGVCPAKPGQKHLIMNFGKDPFTGEEGTCNKYNWATKCKVSWDGITYGVKNPCEEDTSEDLT
jgi:hypothetical protein